MLPFLFLWCYHKYQIFRKASYFELGDSRILSFTMIYCSIRQVVVLPFCLVAHYICFVPEECMGCLGAVGPGVKYLLCEVESRIMCWAVGLGAKWGIKLRYLKTALRWCKTALRLVQHAVQVSFAFWKTGGWNNRYGGCCYLTFVII